MQAQLNQFFIQIHWLFEGGHDDDDSDGDTNDDDVETNVYVQSEFIGMTKFRHWFNFFLIFLTFRMLSSSFVLGLCEHVFHSEKKSCEKYIIGGSICKVCG